MSDQIPSILNLWIQRSGTRDTPVIKAERSAVSDKSERCNLPLDRVY